MMKIEDVWDLDQPIYLGESNGDERARKTMLQWLRQHEPRLVLHVEQLSDCTEVSDDEFDGMLDGADDINHRPIWKSVAPRVLLHAHRGR